MYTVKENDKNTYQNGNKQYLIEYLSGKGISLKNDLIPFYSPTIAFFPFSDCHLPFNLLEFNQFTTILQNFSKMPSPKRAKSYFTGSEESSTLRTSVSSLTAFQSFCFRFNMPSFLATVPEWISSGQ